MSSPCGRVPLHTTAPDLKGRVGRPTGALTLGAGVITLTLFHCIRVPAARAWGKIGAMRGAELGADTDSFMTELSKPMEPERVRVSPFLRASTLSARARPAHACPRNPAYVHGLFVEAEAERRDGG
jgi:hypothetical protein